MVATQQLLSTLFWLLLIYQQRHNELASRQSWDKHYDLIVVGAGSAGSIVAARVSEKPHLKVLLLEAGGPTPVQSDIPGLLKFYGTEYDWGYKAVPQQKMGFSFIDLQFSRAKMLGGGSAYNLMNYDRGKVVDFDRWRNEFGLSKLWSYQNLLKYFQKSIHFVDLESWDPPNPKPGPIAVSKPHLDETYKTFLKLINESGYPIIQLTDFSGVGVSLMPKNIKNGLRSFVEPAFLQPSCNRSNLHIVAFAQVTKLNFVRVAKTGQARVKSVTFYRNGEYHTVYAKEVVLAAGTIGTPQILMLSGVGPKNHLKQLNIHCWADLPVGNNIQDEPAVPFYFSFVNGSNRPANDILLNDIYEALVNRTGTLTIVTPVTLSYRTSVTKSSELDPKWPDSEIRVSSGLYGPNNYKKNNSWTSYLGSCLQEECITILIRNARPKSRGTVRLKSTSPFDAPLIDPCYLCDKYDLDVHVAGSREILRLINTRGFKKFIRFLGPIPDCQPCKGRQNSVDCQEYLECHIRSVGSQFSLVSGSCRVGPLNNSQTVVGEDFRVKGFANLRVVDCSVLPQVPSGHMNAVAMMIGEFGADAVLKEWS